MKELDRMLDYLSDANPEAIRFDGLDLAIMGVGQQWGSPTVLVYSGYKIIMCLREQGMGEDESLDWYTHNVMCLAVGLGTPFILDDLP
jgi:hypothetical protein